MVNATFAHRMSKCGIYHVCYIGANLNLLYICHIGKHEQLKSNFSCSDWSPMINSVDQQLCYMPGILLHPPFFYFFKLLTNLICIHLFKLFIRLPFNRCSIYNRIANCLICPYSFTLSTIPTRSMKSYPIVRG